ncbi:MAG: DMT family transporter [Flavobacteriaceae bacterium]|nr:DMT family transporter [Flavobacteriaceae bacterium]
MQFEKRFFWGVIMAVVGIVFFSSKAVMVKLAYQYEVTAIHLLVFRMLFSLPFYLLMAWRYPSNMPISNYSIKDYVWLIFFGVIGYYVASLFDFLGLRYISAGLERIVLFVYPTIVVLLGYWFLKKPVDKAQKTAIAITYIGLLVTFWNQLSIEGSKVWFGALLVFFCAITYAMYLVGSEYMIPKFGVKAFTSYSMIIACVATLVHYGMQDQADLWSYPWQVYMIGLMMAVFATIIPSYLVVGAISKIGSSDFAILASLGPIATISLAYWVLGEVLSIEQFIGGTIIVLGVLYLGMIKRKKARLK